MVWPLLWVLLLCLQTCPETAGSNTDVCIMNGILGETVTFRLNIPEPQQVVTIAWRSTTSVAFVQTEDSGTAPKVFVTHQNYYNRINVSEQNYNLEMRNLRMEDAGNYEADINLKTSGTITKKYKLQIYRRLGKPKITKSLMTSVNSTCNVTLTCFVEEEDNNVNYSWSPLGEEGNIIQIFQHHGDPEHNYTCTAWNPVSNSSDAISAQQLCTGTGLSHQRSHIGMLSTVAVFSLFILIILPVLLLLLCKTSGEADAKKTIYTYVSGATQQTESTIYDEIPHIKVNKISSQDSKTPASSIYENVI